MYFLLQDTEPNVQATTTQIYILTSQMVQTTNPTTSLSLHTKSRYVLCSAPRSIRSKL